MHGLEVQEGFNRIVDQTAAAAHAAPQATSPVLHTNIDNLYNRL